MNAYEPAETATAVAGWTDAHVYSPAPRHRRWRMLDWLRELRFTTLLDARYAHADVPRAHAVDIRLDPALKLDPSFVAMEATIPEALSRIPDASVDLLLLISVLEHLETPLSVLKECYRVLKPGGKILLNVPTWRGRWFLELAAFKLGLCPAEEIDDHKTYYEIATLWPLLVESGFKPSRLKVKKIKFGLTIFAVAQKAASCC